jgi:excisionase family DNA binding protein
LATSEKPPRVYSNRDELPTVLTVEETAAVLRIGRSATYEALRLNRIPHFRVGKHIRIGRDQLFAWMEAGGLERIEEAPQNWQVTGGASRVEGARHAGTRQRLQSL